MMWFAIALLVIAIVVIDKGFKDIKRVIDENDTRYMGRFIDNEARITKIESKINWSVEGNK
jgi:hypothetical protein